MTSTIWIDADSCPKIIRDYVVNYAQKLSFKVFFVANKQINANNPNYTMIICPQEKDSADNYIFNECKENDIVITRDILLAERLVEKNVCTINDRGTTFTKENIKDKVSDRNFDLQLAQIGLGGNKKSTFNMKQFTKFANCFDKEIQKIIRK